MLPLMNDSRQRCPPFLGALVAPVAVILLAACGSGADDRPVPPAVTPPVPPPEPAPPASVLRARVSVISVPSPYSGAYPEGEWIRLLAELEQPVQVSGSPRVAIEIGDTTRHADFSPWVAHRISDPQHKRTSQVKRGFELAPRFDYLVRAEDRDEDGIRIGPDAFDFTEGNLRDEAGDQVRVEIHAVSPTEFDGFAEPGEDLHSHPVIGRPQPRRCTNERDLALVLGAGARWGPSVLIDEWDGAPFLFYFSLVGLPEGNLADAQRVLDTVERLSARIEEQIGYSILEVAGWKQDPRIEWPDASGAGACDWRTPGEIIGLATDSPDVPGAAAYPRCALWAKGGTFDFANGTVAHELFHIFGFTHHPQDWRAPGEYGNGVFMSRRLNGAYVDRKDIPVSFEDVDALRCIFPQHR